MPDASAAVWVTRPAPGNAVTARAIEAAGYEVLALPVLRVRTLPFQFPADGPPDWFAFVSANAVRGLETGDARMLAACKANSRAACVGRRTAEVASELGWTVELIPEQANADGLLETFRSTSLHGQEIWIPAGNREGSARRTLPVVLRERGAEVEVFGVYLTEDMTPLPEDLHRLEDATPGAIVFHSPSTVSAVFGPDAPEAFRAWGAAALAVSIGPVTTSRLRSLGAPSVSECREPSDEAVVETLKAWKQ
jgi:uroporphyrinogen-III synthase